MPDLMSAMLIERDAKALVAHRCRAPFAGQWVLPLVVVRDDEAAEEALRRHAREQFAVDVGAETFAETVYITDPDDQRQYVANIFRTPIDGAMRFNAEGEYDDARWLGADDLDALWMPPDLRLPLIKILTDPEGTAATDWAATYTAGAQGTPLGEAPPSTIDEGPAPDNRASWDAISAAWQAERGGDRFGTKLMWSWRASEDDLHVLGDVGGKRVIVLGCGGGQDAVALAKLGASAVGIDQSPKQLEYARAYAQRNAADNASFVQCAVEDLTRFDDASFDLAVSIHVLDYVQEIGAALHEAARVLKTGGVLAIAVKHPFDVRVDGPPYATAFTVWTSYWTAHNDMTLSFQDGIEGRFRTYYRTMAQWFDSLSESGFAIERIIEPNEGELAAIADELDNTWMSMMPYTLILKARKR